MQSPRLLDFSTSLLRDDFLIPERHRAKGLLGVELVLRCQSALSHAPDASGMLLSSRSTTILMKGIQNHLDETQDMSFMLPREILAGLRDLWALERS